FDRIAAVELLPVRKSERSHGGERLTRKGPVGPRAHGAPRRSATEEEKGGGGPFESVVERTGASRDDLVRFRRSESDETDLRIAGYASKRRRVGEIGEPRFEGDPERPAHSIELRQKRRFALSGVRPHDDEKLADRSKNDRAGRFDESGDGFHLALQRDDRNRVAGARPEHE